MLRTATACTFSTSQLPKVVRSWCVFHILTSKCTSRHKGMHFFSITTSKSGPEPVCSVHLDFQMYFAPQGRALFWRALFQHPNFEKWPGAGVFCNCWLPNGFAPQPRALFWHLNFQRGPNMVCFNAFHFKMCFAPQWRESTFSCFICQDGSAPAALASLLF